LPRLLLDLWPQILLLGSFAAFVAWNGGVVLGDKANHVATIHLTQMLYIWPLIVFFSWPVILPIFSDLPALRRRLPSLITTATCLALMFNIVHFNTIVHPFTLSDNRHYVFYIFAILRRHWIIKYAVIPIYFICGWLVLTAFGGAPESQPNQKTIRILHSADTVSVSDTLVWLIATSLSLITAPLVEPRYFIVPWLMWRLAVPEYKPKSKAQQKFSELGKSKSAAKQKKVPPASLLQAVLNTLAVYSAYIELVWYLAINVVTGYMFLYKGFDWPQEPGNVQRFMW
jgi:alpha-1,2-glucosyltransferase